MVRPTSRTASAPGTPVAAGVGPSRWPRPSSSSRRRTSSPTRPTTRCSSLAPYMMVAGIVATFVVIPIGPSNVARDLDIGVFYLLAISSLSTLGVLMAGWRSANKYSLMGGLRAGAQLIAYELPLVLTLVAVAVQAGTMSLVGIVDAQAAPVDIGGFAISLPYYSGARSSASSSSSLPPSPSSHAPRSTCRSRNPS